MTTTSTSKEKDILPVSEEQELENPLLNMPPLRQRFIHLYMTGQYSITGLAELLDLHPNTLYGWLKREDVKEIISDMEMATHDIVSTQMKSMTLKAMNRIRELMDSPIDGVALQAVKDVLDRSGHKPKQIKETNVNVRTFEEELDSLINETIEGEWTDIE